MALVYDNKEYSPSEIAKTLSDECGHKVTPSVIRKWDNEIYSEMSDRKRDKNEARNYRYEDFMAFNAIAMLRRMGYSVKDVKNMLPNKKKTSAERPDMLLDMNGKKILVEIKSNIEKEKRAITLLVQYFEDLQPK
jgi:DNA-binding transcriptional MerR regulator